MNLKHKQKISERNCIIKRSYSLLTILALGISLNIFYSGVALAVFIPGDNINVTLEGCRQTAANTIVFPDPDSTNGSPQGFICEEGQGGSYSTGQVFFWNELDLVPFRLTLRSGARSTTPTYDTTIAADFKTNGGLPGYDVVTAPEVNTTLSHSSCAVLDDGGATHSVGPSLTGGAASSVYRTIRMQQNPGTTCVIDYTLRVAVGASQIPGGSLSAYQFSQDGFQGGNRTVPIFTNNILPQELRKGMTAQQPSDYHWSVAKEPTPAHVSFANTCDATKPTSEKVSIRVEWKIYPGVLGKVMIVNSIYAKNPASRSVTVNVQDTIYENDPDGTDPSLGDVLNTAQSGPVAVPGNQEILVFEHSFEADADVSGLSDTAVATYIDTLTGINIEQKTTAVASASVQSSGSTNSTATIVDTESISGTGLQYSADSTSAGSTDGDFTLNNLPYILGTKLIKDSANLVWTSVTQNGLLNCSDPAGCSVGFVEFNKTIYVDPVPVNNLTGTLHDKAVLTASDGFTAEHEATIDISANAQVEFNLVKTIPNILQGDEKITCNFEVKNSQNEIVAKPTFEFTAGETKEETLINGLLPDTYTVNEGTCGGLVPSGSSSQQVNLNLPTCSAEVIFENIVGAGSAVAEVDKVTYPAGNENGWEMTLKGPGTGADGITLVTSDGASGAFERFAGNGGDFKLQEGNYTITETLKDGWEQTASSNCTFTVDYPRDIGKTFSCTITNKKLGTIIIKKLTDPAGGTDFGFTQDILKDANGQYAPFSLADNTTKTFEKVSAATYVVTENDPTPDYDLVDLTCTEDSNNVTTSSFDKATRKSTINLDPGETVQCTYTNRKRGTVEVLKLTNGIQDLAMVWNFTLSGPAGSVSDSTPPALMDFGGAKIIPGETYRICETGIPPSWTSQWSINGTIIPFIPAVNNSPVGASGYSGVFDPNYVAPPAIYTNDTRCINFVVKPGQHLSIQVDNQRPGGEPRTIGYWKNWNSCTGGRQVETAEQNGGTAAGWFLLDDLLNDPGYTLGLLILDEGDCIAATRILDKSDIVNGKKKASDAAYNMAAQLLAAMLNLSAGAETCTAVQTAVTDGKNLLTAIGFNGTGSYLTKSNTANYATAQSLASKLDKYNNGFLCP